MKKVQLMIIALLMLVSNAMADGRFIYRSSAVGCECTLDAICKTVDNGDISIIEISLSSPDSHQFFAFQMFIVLNEGITLIPDEEEDYGEFVIIPSDRFGNTDKKKAKYGIQIAQKDNGYQIVCLNQQGNAILEYEGLLLTIPINGVTQGMNIIGQIDEIEFTTLNGEAVRLGDVQIFNNTDVGIETIEANRTSNSVIYNLNGQRVKTANNGMYIKDGKIMVVKQ